MLVKSFFRKPARFSMNLLLAAGGYAVSYEAAAQRYAPFLSGISQVSKGSKLP